MQVVWKKQGETPLEALKRVSTNERATYVGRLDPMANGLLLILEGEECERAEAYRGLDKRYEYSFMLGVETDSSDMLGLPTNRSDKKVSDEEVREVVESIIGNVTLPYPIYSSKPVEGVPLHEHARRGSINEIKIPTFSTTVFEHEVLRVESVNLQTILEQNLPHIASVRGDFRTQQIIDSWNGEEDRVVKIVHARAHVSSGTYIRSIVQHIGVTLGTGATATSITRTSIGEWTTATNPSPSDTP